MNCIRKIPNIIWHSFCLFLKKQNVTKWNTEPYDKLKNVLQQSFFN